MCAGSDMITRRAERGEYGDDVQVHVYQEKGGEQG